MYSSHSKLLLLSVGAGHMVCDGFVSFSISFCWLSVFISCVAYRSRAELLFFPGHRSLRDEQHLQYLHHVLRSDRAASLQYASPPLSPISIEETEDHKIIISELISAKTAIHKLQYEEDCAQNGYIAASADPADRQSAISSLQSLVQSLESQSAAPQIRQSIHRIMRKCLIYENWEQLHCLYVG